jgi:hypothetical protein
MSESKVVAVVNAYTFPVLIISVLAPNVTNVIFKPMPKVGFCDSV